MTLKELALHLNLSPTTVSRALNGYPEVNAETRRRVMDAAKAMNYAPNLVAQRLATGRARAVGHVLPLADHQMINPIFAEFITGASDIYSAAGYDMLLRTVPQADELDTYRTMAERRAVDGFILHGPLVNDSRMPVLRKLGLPVVIHGRTDTMEADQIYLDVDNREAFGQATRHLIGLGHTRIALLNGLETMTYARMRRDGFEAAMAEAGLPLDPALMASRELTETHGYQVVQRWLDLPDPPTALMASSILTAMGMLRAVQDRGLTLGRDVSIITHDDDMSFLRNEGEVPLFTCTHSSIRAAGRRCAEMILHLITHGTDRITSELWTCDLVEGRSTGPAPHRTT
ncbi:MAG: substrate-binding domain-containing protein [Pseudomonadota bacterium]